MPAVANVLLPALFEEAQSGGDAAFAELYAETRVRIYGVVLGVVRSPDLAVEVTQEVFLEIWQQRGQFEAGRGSVLGWMTTIARRRAVDRVRAVTRTHAREQRYVLVNAPVAGDVWDDVAMRMDARRVHRAISGLSPVQRDALLLVYVGHRSAREAALLLDVPLGTVKTRVRDGLIQLRLVLGVVAVE